VPGKFLPKEELGEEVEEALRCQVVSIWRLFS
jgi:hypothetical protein